MYGYNSTRPETLVVECGNTDLTTRAGYEYPGGGGHTHQLPYGGVPLFRVDFEKPVSLKEGVILSNFPKIGCDFIKFP